MKTVIDRNRMDRHTVDKYKFKVLAMGGSPEPQEEPKRSVFAADEEPHENVVQPEQAAAPVEHVEVAPDVATGSRDEMIESLMKKADEMSSTVIKMQMKIEEMEAAHKIALEETRAQGFEEGQVSGRQLALEEGEAAGQEAVTQFAASVQNLESRSLEFNQALEAIKGDLLHAAIDIAREVVVLEVGENSTQIAKKLADQLIEDLQEASKITLRVNPADHGPISEAVGSMERIEVISDSAVNRGGVVAISDSGNIDAEVMKRFERIKNAALSG
jgi:flagellar assembly protein FliH